jgi:hypothetical protein
LGIFNLPPDQAHDIAGALALYTATPESRMLGELLRELDSLPDVLIVLNHPLSCELRLERAEHLVLLREFLGRYGGHLHALELNGLQPAADNREVLRMANEQHLPVISGGDRHCLEPSANVNLTNATTFAEFVHEVRREQRSHVLFLPQYCDAIATRYIEFVRQAMDTYPQFTGRRHWTDRVFYEHELYGLRPMSSVWEQGVPWAIQGALAAFGFVATRRDTLRLAFGMQGEIGA